MACATDFQLAPSGQVGAAVARVGGTPGAAALVFGASAGDVRSGGVATAGAANARQHSAQASRAVAVHPRFGGAWGERARCGVWRMVAEG